MQTERRSTVIAIALAAASLLWPAFWNGYPLVFSDTGTYLSQAIERYAGWDRPVFYSLFLLPLHMTITTWPAIGVQALLVAHVLHLLRRTFAPGTSVWRLLPLTGALAIGSALPWFAAQLMPDVFTGLLVLVLSLLGLAHERLSRWERAWLVALATFMIASHQSHLLLALVLLPALLVLRHRQGHGTVCAVALQTATPLMLAAAVLVSVNLFAFGRASLSPFGNVFLLARIIYDGPGMDVLRRDCPAAGWRLCVFADAMPATSDDFLWREDGPVTGAGGGKMVSREADAIIRAALVAEPGTELRALGRNTAIQLVRFATGDGLQPWPATVGPWIKREFPRFEAAAYAGSRQTGGTLRVPAWLQSVHAALALAGAAACCGLALLPSRGTPCATGFATAALLGVLANAAIAGGLSGPHDRYQSRIMWLPPLVAILGVTSLRPAVTHALAQ
jgi:hypothetical protein